MSNLIITIISIALVAVMALMGIWYGAAAFQNSQAKAKAGQIMKAAEQIASAWQAYALTQGGSMQIPAVCNFNAFITGGQLSSMPAPVNSAGVAIGIMPLKITTAGVTTNCTADSNMIQFGGLDQEVCAEINRITKNNSTVPTNPLGSSIYSLSDNGYCTYHTSGSAYFYRLRILP